MKSIRLKGEIFLTNDMGINRVGNHVFATQKCTAPSQLAVGEQTAQTYENACVWHQGGDVLGVSRLTGSDRLPALAGPAVVGGTQPF